MSILSLFEINFARSVSGLHLTPVVQSVIRENGQLKKLTDYPVLTFHDTKEVIVFVERIATCERRSKRQC